jgi:hypothetical protein
MTSPEEIENMANGKNSRGSILYIVDITFNYEDFVYNGNLIDNPDNEEEHQLYLNDYLSRESNYYIERNLAQFWQFEGYLNNLNVSAHSKTITALFIDFNQFNKFIELVYENQFIPLYPIFNFSINALYL